MKKQVFFAVAAMALASCSSDGLVNNSAADQEAPIAFGVEKKNITRGANFETLERYNFGVWAYKYKEDAVTQQVMGNYLVGYCNETTKKGYEHSGSTTWNQSAGDLDDYKSPWFYENLGNKEYTYNGDEGYYKADQSAYMSANENQYLRYWDLAYTNTNFYAYAPYKASGVRYENGTIIVDNGAQTAGYSDNSKTEFLYAGYKALNSDKKDVLLQFYHLGAKVNLQFYEDIPGYKVQLLDVTTSGTGIQATPAFYDESQKKNVLDNYYTTCGATIKYNENMVPTAAVSHINDAANKSNKNLKFDLPSNTEIPQAGASTPQDYAKSPTTYYAVAQPTTSEVGFTFHVSYKLIAEDNGEEITVHDARVYVPAKSVSGETTTYIAAWQPNTAYTYTFKITNNSTGSTSTTTPNIEDPTIPTEKALYPIVFDGATVEVYSTSDNGSDF